MYRNAAFIIAIGLLASTSQAAVADPAYTAKDIIEHFAPQNSLGDPRGLCIGTETETRGCNGTATPVATARPAEGFDLVVTFGYDSDVLTKNARDNLEQFSKALKDPRLASFSFVVEGHTDAKGSERYNLVLSERRANAVVRYLKEKGISTANLEARGFGKAKPRVPDPFDPSNRRVETRLRVE
jgi:outer membrane protein OmpA-like peptidoglycan-associated protein